jgi:hypothetical protein
MTMVISDNQRVFSSVVSFSIDFLPVKLAILLIYRINLWFLTLCNGKLPMDDTDHGLPIKRTEQVRGFPVRILVT